METQVSPTPGEGASKKAYDWGPKLDETDVKLLERLVEGVCRYRMEVPTIFMLESLMPLALIGSQAMHFMSPMIGIFIGPGDYDRLAHLVERRDVIERMMCRLEWAIDDERG